MDDRCRVHIGGVAPAELERVAAGAIGSPVSLAGEVFVDTLKASHAAKQTIGVVKVSGMARLADGSERNWSSVAKLVDLREQPDAGRSGRAPRLKRPSMPNTISRGEDRSSVPRIAMA